MDPFDPVSRNLSRKQYFANWPEKLKEEMASASGDLDIPDVPEPGIRPTYDTRFLPLEPIDNSVDTFDLNVISSGPKFPNPRVNPVGIFWREQIRKALTAARSELVDNGYKDQRDARFVWIDRMYNLNIIGYPDLLKNADYYAAAKPRMKAFSANAHKVMVNNDKAAKKVVTWKDIENTVKGNLSTSKWSDELNSYINNLLVLRPYLSSGLDAMALIEWLNPAAKVPDDEFVFDDLLKTSGSTIPATDIIPAKPEIIDRDTNKAVAYFNGLCASYGGFGQEPWRTAIQKMSWALISGQISTFPDAQDLSLMAPEFHQVVATDQTEEQVRIEYINWTLMLDKLKFESNVFQPYATFLKNVFPYLVKGLDPFGSIAVPTPSLDNLTNFYNKYKKSISNKLYLDILYADYPEPSTDIPTSKVVESLLIPAGAVIVASIATLGPKETYEMMYDYAMISGLAVSGVVIGLIVEELYAIYVLNKRDVSKTISFILEKTTSTILNLWEDVMVDVVKAITQVIGEIVGAVVKAILP